MKKILLLSLLAVSLFQFSCKKDDDTTVTQDTSTGVSKTGTSVNGTINTKSQDNVTQNFSFNFEYAGEPTLYAPDNGQSIYFYVMKSFVTGYGGSTDYTSGRFYFNAADSIHSAPDDYYIYLYASNPTNNGTFMYSNGSNITESNSTISNYHLNGNTISFTVTTNSGYTGDNGNTAAVVLNFTLPYTTTYYRMASH